MSVDADSALLRLQNWYRAQCNGDWEHSYGISIDTLDNPGWRLKIELTDTPLELKSFTEIKLNYDHSDQWLICFKKDKTFEGAGGPEMLSEMVTIFLNWADQ